MPKDKQKDGRKMFVAKILIETFRKGKYGAETD